MALSIFDLIYKLISAGWNLISGIAGLSLRFFSAIFSFGLKAAGSFFNLMLSPLTQDLDWFWDWSRLDLRALFTLIMWALLAACAVLALFAVGSNVWRKYHSSR